MFYFGIIQGLLHSLLPIDASREFLKTAVFSQMATLPIQHRLKTSAPLVLFNAPIETFYLTTLSEVYPSPIKKHG